jgi:hypothetical protein
MKLQRFPQGTRTQPAVQRPCGFCLADFGNFKDSNALARISDRRNRGGEQVLGRHQAQARGPLAVRWHNRTEPSEREQDSRPAAPNEVFKASSSDFQSTVRN